MPSARCQSSRSRRVELMKLFASLLAAAAIALPAASSVEEPRRSLVCHLNTVISTCKVFPVGNNGFRVEFDHADKPSFTFTPARIGNPDKTTDGEIYLDGRGKEWRLFGHHSMHLVEWGGFLNQLYIENP